jgi:exosortase
MNRSLGSSIRVALLLLAALVAWSNWPLLVELHRRWSTDPQYSHGYLVPLFSLYLLWRRRERLAAADSQPHWTGVVVLLIAALMRLAGSYYYFPWLSSLSLLPTLAGLALLLGGRPALAWSWPAIAFLAFMLPLPYSVQVALAAPLQLIATSASTYLLETCGIPVLAEGNIIHLPHHDIGVVEACNGLSMLVTFLALCAALAILLRRHWIEKVVIVLSAIPIALGVNILRLSVTGLLYETAGDYWGNLIFHDLAGWLMMVVALALVGLELWLLRLLLANTPARARPATLYLATPERRATRNEGRGLRPAPVLPDSSPLAPEK